MKSKFKLLIFVFALFLTGFYSSANMRSIIISSSSALIANAYFAFDYAKAKTLQYFDTTAQISRLREENAELARLKLLYSALKSDYAELLGASSAKIPGAKLLRINSLERLGEKTRFWADASAPESPRGLAANDQAVGVLSAKEGRAHAISLADAGCAIAAKIGTQQAIVRGDGRDVWADFIEDYAQIRSKMRVLTSGMDGIFPAGILIGTVGEIEQHAGYKRARIEGVQPLLAFRFVYAFTVR